MLHNLESRGRTFENTIICTFCCLLNAPKIAASDNESLDLTVTTYFGELLPDMQLMKCFVHYPRHPIVVLVRENHLQTKPGFALAQRETFKIRIRTGSTRCFGLLDICSPLMAL
jgi:hypothetical protein